MVGVAHCQLQGAAITEGVINNHTICNFMFGASVVVIQLLVVSTDTKNYFKPRNVY